MTQVIANAADRTTVAGRTFARTGPDGRIDGAHERGIYSQDLRIARRVEAFRAEREIPVIGTVALGEHAAAVRFELADVEPGTGVLLALELDGTDLFTVRELQFAEVGASEWLDTMQLGDARPDARVRLAVVCSGAELVHRDGVALSDGPIAADGTARTAAWRWDVPAGAGSAVDVVIELQLSWALSSSEQPPATQGFEQLQTAHRTELAAWRAGRPVVSGVPGLVGTIETSLEDLAHLRIPTDSGWVLAAGVPWFLTVFGRDALLAAWMALPVDPSLAVSTLRHLAATQAQEYDLSIDAEPGKIMHEERHGIAANRWHARYYGSVDATPLFLMLLAETCRWTGDDSIARELEQPARQAVAWILARIDEDELGLVGCVRHAPRGLDVQSWKDSPDSQRDHTGRIATGLLRPLEAQAYSVAALRGAARLAQGVWNDRVVGSEWAGAARQLERRFIERALVELPSSQLAADDDPRRNGYLAQAIDQAGLPVDSLCSNAGHALWADAITDPALRARIIAQLTSPALASGWGIRTMSTLDSGYDPTSYHCGSVWPHDTAICVAGIARTDRDAAASLANDLFEAARGCGGSLPELIAGDAREEDEQPQLIARACRPQAWSAAAPLLLLRSLLGLEPDITGANLVAATGEMPSWMAGLQWRGVHALGRRWNVTVGSNLHVDVTRVH